MGSGCSSRGLVGYWEYFLLVNVVRHWEELDPHSWRDLTPTWGDVGHCWAGCSERLFQASPCRIPCFPGAGRGRQYLEDALVVDLVEDGAVDLVGLQGHPVEDGHAELGLDGLLDLHSWGQGMENP